MPWTDSSEAGAVRWTTRVRWMAGLLIIGAWGLLTQTPSRAADWPMWRFDASRSAASPEQLPADLQLLWSRELGPRKQAWDDALNLDLMTYDRLFEPVVQNGILFLGFNDRDKLTAYDLATGLEQWSYFADGPVRLPPVAWQDRVFFASDDGKLYCVKSSDGTLLWSFRGGPNGRQVLGNQRLISAWPMRGGPVVRDGKVYFAASIWPFMGTFIYALDAETGQIVWVNDETGAQYIKQPHSAPSFAGVAPQGALVATENALLVPGGRSVPAAFDRQTGKLLYFELNAGGKGTGGSFVAANEESWFVHTRQKGTREFALQTGIKTAFQPNEPVLAGDRIYSAQMQKDRPVISAHDHRAETVLWEFPADGQGDLILAGDTLFAAGKPTADANGAPHSLLTGIQLPAAGAKPVARWTTTVPGTVERLVAAQGKLVAVTLEGNVFVYGRGTPPQNTTIKDSPTPLVPAAELSQTVEQLLSGGSAEGYALWLGAEDESLVTALAARSPFVELTVVDEATQRVERLRRQFDAAGIYGRVTAHPTPRSEWMPPPYFANMLFVGRELSTSLVSDRELLARIYDSVRPYGGVLYLLAKSGEVDSLARQVTAGHLEKAEVTTTAEGVLVRRVGPLPGAGSWTHQYGDVANSIKSNDQRVKLPLGVLWFGGISHDDVLPRHGHGPPEQVVGGRLFIQGMNSLTARDVYTGRVLWKREFKDLGTYDVYFDETYKETPLDTAYNQVHIPGANARGTNYVVTHDRIYILEGVICHVLDPATGKTLTDIELPQADRSQPQEWGYIGVWGDVLLGGVGFAKYRSQGELEAELDKGLSRNKLGFGAKSLDRAASLALVGFNRYTGEQLWKVEARHSFWHNGIAAGGGRLYALDRNPKPVEDFLRRRGKSNPASYRLVAFDIQTGQPVWELPGQVFGTWLGYSERHDLLLQAGAAASDRLTSEVGQGMAVYRGHSGELVWKKDDLKYSGPCVIHNDLIITNANSYAESAGAFYLADGSQKMVENALTGKLQPWKITRAYGCNSLIASENMLTFRSGAAGFYDLLTEAGTGNFGGFRSGCTANLVAADGVLNAPDYTRTCSCSYQNQTSLALVHMPELDAWTISNTEFLEPSGGRVRRVGINLGAPGDRRDPQGLMWLEYPAVAGDSPNLGLEIRGDAQRFQDHPSTMPATPDAPIPWVASSGIEGLTGIRLSLKAQRSFTLRSGQPVEQADDDAEESSDGGVTIDSSSLEMGQKDQDRQWVAFRFQNIHLARAAEIKSAHLQFTARAAGETPAEFVIQAEVSGNAPKFTEKNRSISSRPRTTTQIRWSPGAWTKEGDAGPAQQSPDLAPLIREIVQRDDWEPGNALVLIVSGTGTRVAAPCRGKDSSPAKLVIDAEEVVPMNRSAEPKSAYRLRLHFGVPRIGAETERRFDLDVAGQAVVEDLAVGGVAGKSRILTVERVLLDDWLELGFTPRAGRPVLSGIELERLDD